MPGAQGHSFGAYTPHSRENVSCGREHPPAEARGAFFAQHFARVNLENARLSFADETIHVVVAGFLNASEAPRALTEAAIAPLFSFLLPEGGPVNRDRLLLALDRDGIERGEIDAL